MLESFIAKVQSNHDLSETEMETAISAMLQGKAQDDEMAQLLLAIREKGESISELVGAANSLRSAMTPIRTSRHDLLDTCGTGGDGARTFNISTAAALVAAAAGACVAKHGNRKITSLSGSADVLAALGIRIDASREVVEMCLEQVGIGFCFAPLLHPAMKQVAEVRKSLKVPTLFNYLGPLCNPAGAQFQLLGVGKSELQGKIASAIARLPVKKALIVRGFDGMDEISLSAETSVMMVEQGTIAETVWSPETFGLRPIDPNSIRADTPDESAQVIRGVFDGLPSPARDITVANAAAGLWLAGHASDLIDAVDRCQKAISSGQAKRILERLAGLSHS